MASIDALVYNMASRDNEQSTIFVRKDWLSINDNQSGLYNSNQCIIDTSSLSNSNKYTGYKEAYLNIPLLLFLQQQDQVLFSLPPLLLLV